MMRHSNPSEDVSWGHTILWHITVDVNHVIDRHGPHALVNTLISVHTGMQNQGLCHVGDRLHQIF
jgi:hypothetical protein